MASLNQNTWSLDEWYAQQVAGNTDYGGVKQLWMFGTDAWGDLAQNTQGTQRSSPTQIPAGPGAWAAPIIHGGCNNGPANAALKADGSMWVWGGADYGSLGQNNKTYRSSPVQIPSGPAPAGDWAGGVTAGTWMMGVKDNGRMYSWGRNEFGQLGHNTATQYSSPRQVPGTTWSGAAGKLAVSSSTATAIKTDGTMWVTGNNNNHETGTGNPTNQDLSSPTQIPGTWTYCARGEECGFGIKSDGSLWSWGYNYYGQLGLNHTTTRDEPNQIPGTWSAVMGVQASVIGLKTDGSMWGWGYGENGKLGLNEGGGGSTKSSPVQVGTDTDWAKLSLGTYQTAYAIKQDGTIWAWGHNTSGQLGLNSTNNPSNNGISSPTQIPGITNAFQVRNVGGAAMIMKNV